MMEKTRIRLRIATIAIFCMLAIVAPILLWQGISHNDEPTLAHPENSWGPLLLGVDCEGLCSIVHEEMRTMNERLGTQVFSAAHDPADIVVHTGLPPEGADCPEDGGGCFVLEGYDGTYVHCDVYVYNNPDIAIEADVVAHELGHCLGLAHDDYDGSIMYPVQSHHWFPPRISDADREALRKAYGIRNR